MSKFVISLNQEINNAKLLINKSLIKINQNILNLFNYPNSKDLSEGLSNYVSNALSKIIVNYLETNLGKQFRPLLLLLTYNAIYHQQLKRQSIQKLKNLEDNDLINVATFIELIHMASILHDDVLDNAKFRRTQKTMNVSLGNKFAILTGDLIYSKAFKLLHNINPKNYNNIKTILTDTVNCMIEGEIMQYLEKYNFAISESQYLKIMNCKTAKLFCTVAQITMLLDVNDKDYKYPTSYNASNAHNANHADIANNISDNNYINNKLNLEHSLSQYGLNFGIAYQLLNDIEDFYKNGEDIINGIITLPIIFVLNKKDAAVNKKIVNIIKKQADLNAMQQKQQLKVLKNIISIQGGFNYTINLANNYLIQAMQEIDLLKNSKYKEAILNIIKSCIIHKE